MKRHQQATTTYFPIRTDLPCSAACREGFTILEVLISAGIMVIGLACVASLLPAAAQRMSQAVSEDRAGTLAANAYADITARRSLGLLSATPPGVAHWPRDQFVTMGTVAAELQKVAVGVNGESVSSVLNTATLFPNTGWLIEDALVFDDDGGSPVNTFDTNTNGRKIRPNPMCWLATLVPVTANNPVEAGDIAELSIAVFKKQPSSNEIILGGLGEVTPGVLTIGGNQVDDDTRRQFVKGCGSVLALSTHPEWIRVNASWTDNNGTLNDTSDDVTHIIVDPLRGGSNYSGNVVLFTNLLRVEKHRIVLD